MADNLTMVSLNVAGLNNPRLDLTKLILAEQADLVCFQETHLGVTEERYLREMYCGIIYHAPTFTKSKGVMLRISWTCDNTQ